MPDIRRAARPRKPGVRRLYLTGVAGGRALTVEPPLFAPTPASVVVAAPIAVVVKRVVTATPAPTTPPPTASTLAYAPTDEARPQLASRKT